MTTWNSNFAGLLSIPHINCEGVAHVCIFMVQIQNQPESDSHQFNLEEVTCHDNNNTTIIYQLPENTLEIRSFVSKRAGISELTCSKTLLQGLVLCLPEGLLSSFLQYDIHYTDLNCPLPEKH